MKYAKPSLAYPDQADLIINRGMTCDRNELIDCLKSVGYYRLSGYWHDFKDATGSFKPGTDFSIIWNTYSFDRQFRLIVLDTVERIEIHLRARLAYELSHAGGPFGFLDPLNLPRLTQDQHKRFLEKCKDTHARSRERFIEHFKNTYGDEHELPPYWMLVGTMDFGQILTLFRGAPVTARNTIASELGLSARVLESWLICLNTVRNICAHHGRLWNRVLGTKPIIPKDGKWSNPYRVKPDRLFCVLTMLGFLLETIAQQSKWRIRLFELFDKYPTVPKLHMGFETGWENSSLWRP